MSTPQQKFLVPPEVLVPRGTALAALLAGPVFHALRWARRAGLAVWSGLEAHGRKRALRELNDLAARCEDHDPERAQRLRSASRFIAGSTD